MICISSNNVRHPVSKTFTPLHYTCRHFTYSHLNFTKIHFTTFPFRLTAFRDVIRLTDSAFDSHA